MLKKNVKNLVPMAIRWIENVDFPAAGVALYRFIKEGLEKSENPLTLNTDLLHEISKEAVKLKSIEFLNLKIKEVIQISEKTTEESVEIVLNSLLEDLNETLNKAKEYIKEFPECIVKIMRQWRQENMALIKQLNVHVMKGIGNLIYKTKKGNVIRDIHRKVYGDDYPEEADSDSYVTMTDLQNFVKFLNMGSGKLFIDLGCGRGGPGMWIARETGANYLGIDICETAVEKVNQRIKDFGLQKQARFQIADIISTGLPDNEFDGAISIDALQLIQDPQLSVIAFHEINRILRRGANLIFTNGEVHFPNRVNDFRPILQETGFEVQDYYEIPNWKTRRSQVLSKILESRDEIINDMGKLGASFCFNEAQIDLPVLNRLRRVFVVAKKK